MTSESDKSRVEAGVSRVAKHRTRNDYVGIKRVELQLDEATIRKLEILIDLSGYEVNEKGRRNAAVTYAIDFLYKKCVEGYSKKPRLDKEMQLELIAENIATRVVSRKNTSSYVHAAKKLKKYAVPYDSSAKWDPSLVEDLSRVGPGEKEKLKKTLFKRK